SNTDMGKIVFGRLDDYNTPGIDAKSFIDFYAVPGPAGSDILALRIDDSQNFNFQDGTLLTTGTLGTGVGTLSGNNANAAFTLLNLNNTDTPASGETGQTSDLVFKLTFFNDPVAGVLEAAKISAFKVNDWVQVVGFADTDSGLKFYTTNSGTSTLQLTIDNVGLATFVGDITTTGTVSTGGLVASSNFVTINYAVASNDHVVLASASSAITLSLNPAATNTGRIYHVKHIGASVSSVIINPHASELIDEETTLTLAIRLQSVSFQSDGTQWWVF
ncbi:hypothetical protein LCGC14_2834020, partial [marine sediment metagenome]